MGLVGGARVAILPFGVRRFENSPLVSVTEKLALRGLRPVLRMVVDAIVVLTSFHYRAP